MEATRQAGQFDTGRPQASAELSVEDHFRYELMEQGMGHFHRSQETQADKLAEKRYRVSGTVDAIRPNGNAREHRYSCAIRRLPNGEWAAERVFVLLTS